MRWFWIDRFVDFEVGRFARAIKNVTLAEDHLHDHFPGYPLMPKSLIIEGLAQTGGFLVSQYNDFRKKVILAKIPRATFYGEAFPGDQLIYQATIEYIRKDGAMVKATCHKGDILLAEMEIVFAHLDEQFEKITLFDRHDLLRMLQNLRAFEVGRNANGEPLPLPAELGGPIRAEEGAPQPQTEEGTPQQESAANSMGSAFRGEEGEG